MSKKIQSCLYCVYCNKAFSHYEIGYCENTGASREIGLLQVGEFIIDYTDYKDCPCIEPKDKLEYLIALSKAQEV